MAKSMDKRLGALECELETRRAAALREVVAFIGTLPDEWQYSFWRCVPNKPDFPLDDPALLLICGGQVTANDCDWQNAQKVLDAVPEDLGARLDRLFPMS